MSYFAFSQLTRKRVLLVGDLLLDRYTFGKTKRISPEAPVPVLHVTSEEVRFGGAGNVACNLKALNQEVLVLGRIGDDASGKEIEALCLREGISSQYLVVDEGYCTPTKVRLIAASQQLVRVDYEQMKELTANAEQRILELLPQLIDQVDIIALSDYGKGFFTDTVLKKILELANAKKIPVITDPKGIDFQRYSGTTILKPNVHEAYAAANLPATATLEQVAAVLHSRLTMDCLMVTRSEDGISLYHQDGQNHHFSVTKKEVRDVTGAGDTVLAVLVAGFASKLDLTSIIPLCNIAASLAIEKVGCAVVSWEDIASRLFDLMHHGKVLKREDLPLLRYAFEKKPISLVQVFSKDVEALALLRVLHEQSKASHRQIVTHFVDPNTSSELVETAAAIQSVQAVLMGCITPEEAETALNIAQVIQIK